MNDEVTTFEVAVEPFQHFSILENVENGDKEINLTFRSDDNPKSSLLINEGDSKNTEDIMRRNKESRYSKIYQLSELQKFGSEKETITASKNWIYFTFQNHQSDSVTVKVVAESKYFYLELWNSPCLGIKDNTLSTIAYILYMVIMCSIVILFILILCVACIKKRAEEDEESIIANDDIRREFEPESDSEEEEENPITLVEADYDRYFPIINTEIENKDGKITEEICSICIDKILNDEKVRKIRFCGHYFHSGCLTDWIKVNESCPNCKLELNKKNMEKMEKQEKAEKKKKKANRIALIASDMKPVGLSPSSKKSIKPIPSPSIEQRPTRMKRLTRDNGEFPESVAPTNIQVTRQTADVIQNIEPSFENGERNQTNPAEFTENHAIDYNHTNMYNAHTNSSSVNRSNRVRLDSRSHINASRRNIGPARPSVSNNQIPMNISRSNRTITKSLRTPREGF